MTGPVALTAEDLKTQGWRMVEATGFISHVGPLWERTVDRAYEYALLTEDKHHNRRGVVQGGVVMTIADRTCGMTARYVTGHPAMVTVQTVNGQPFRTAWAGTCVSNVRPGYPGDATRLANTPTAVGPQPFDVNSATYKPVLPYYERLK